MGVKQTKIDGSYFPDTSETQKINLCTLSNNQSNANCVFSLEKKDANITNACSPQGCITSTRIGRQSEQYNQVEACQTIGCSSLNENVQCALRRRWLRSFTYNLNDPRSPNVKLNRTPIIFDDSDRTFNMNDTFADLFVETRGTPDRENESLEVYEQIHKHFQNTQVKNKVKIEDSMSLRYEVGESVISSEAQPQTPKQLQAHFNTASEQLQQKIDPRSPTFGVERTPIILNDNEEEESENVMLENILSTLSFEPSSSSRSLTTPSIATEANHIPKLRNKHLELLQTSKKCSKVTMSALRQKQFIYEDKDDENVPTTPKQKKLVNKNVSKTNNGKRTPLSCVKNRSTTRSRSVDINEKSLKTRLSLTSYDDYLNPKECSKVVNLRIMQETGDSIKLS